MHIFSVLKNQNYIDFYGLLTDKLDPKSEFELFFYDETFKKTDFQEEDLNQIQLHIKNILVHSEYDYPIRFFVKSSLQFNFKKQNRMLELRDLD